MPYNLLTRFHPGKASQVRTTHQFVLGALWQDLSFLQAGLDLTLCPTIKARDRFPRAFTLVTLM